MAAPWARTSGHSLRPGGSRAWFGLAVRPGVRAAGELTAARAALGVAACLARPGRRGRWGSGQSYSVKSICGPHHACGHVVSLTCSLATPAWAAVGACTVTLWSLNGDRLTPLVISSPGLRSQREVKCVASSLNPIILSLRNAQPLAQGHSRLRRGFEPGGLGFLDQGSPSHAPGWQCWLLCEWPPGRARVPGRQSPAHGVLWGQPGLGLCLSHSALRAPRPPHLV